MRALKCFAYCLGAYMTVATVTSCCKACGDDVPEINLSFNKYRKHEIDTIVFVRYQPNSNFSILLDSTVSIRDWESQDTTYPSSAFRALPTNAEYIVKITSVGKTFTFSKYQFNQQECGCDHKKVDALSSFTMNGNVLHDTFVELPR